jgi:hypothetical protein
MRFYHNISLQRKEGKKNGERKKFKKEKKLRTEGTERNKLSYKEGNK